jgi:ELWxxDGT repeat protein
MVRSLRSRLPVVLLALLGASLPAQLRVIDFHPTTSSDPELVALGADLYVAASTGQGRHLFRYNPTLPAPVAIVDFSSRQRILTVQQPAVVGPLLFFKGSLPGVGGTLWVMDPRQGDVARALMPNGSDPLEFTAVGTRLFFSADVPGNGRELCVSDGNTAVMVKNIHPSAGSTPTRLAAFGNRVVFRATDGSNGQEPWISDGTAAGTFLLRDIRPSGSSDPAEFTTSGPYCYFSAGDGNGRELWRTDGTATAKMTVRVGSGESDPTALVDFGGTLYFTANGGIGQGFELWRLPGGATTASPVFDLRSGVGSAQPDGTTAVGSLLYFSAILFDNDGRELFAYAPGLPISATNPRQLALNPGSGDGVRRDPFITALGNGNAMVFVGNNGATGFEVWTTTGTSLRLLANVSLPGNSDPDQFTVLGDDLYFAATDQGVFGREVFILSLSGTNSAVWRVVGSACARTDGTYPALSLVGDPILGATTVLTTRGAAPFGQVAVAGSTRRQQIAFGACTWQLDPAPGRFFVLPAHGADAAGTARLSLAIPADVSLLGQRFLFQSIVADAGGQMLGVAALSNAVEAFLGH